MRKQIFLLLLLASATGLAAQKVAELPDIKDPHSVDVDKNELIFLDGFTGYVYSIDPFALRFTFAKEGEGPADFKYRPRIGVTPDFIFGVDYTKTVWFSRKGEPLRTKTYEDFDDFDPNMEMILIPIKENYVRITVDHDLNKRYVYLVDPEGRLTKKLHEGLFDWKGATPAHRILTVCYEDKILISDTERGFFINVFDFQGKHLRTIDKTEEVERIEITESDQKEIAEAACRNEPDWVCKQIKSTPFKKYYPQINHFQVSDDKIYVTTDKARADKFEIIVLDMKGEILDRLFVPMKSKGRYRRIMRFDPYAIHQGKLYEFIKNQATSHWEFHATELP